MKGRIAKFHKVAAFGADPTPFRRLVAAAIAGPMAFGLTQLLLGTVGGAGWHATLFSSIALTVAAMVAVVTVKPARAIVYGLLAAIWLLFEGLVLLLGGIAAGFG